MTDDRCGKRGRICVPAGVWPHHRDTHTQLRLFHAARADLLRRLGQNGAAVEAYSRALELARNPVEQNYLKRMLARLQGGA